MGFLGDEMTQSMLPLMINFEAKSISKQFAALRDTMEKRYNRNYLSYCHVFLSCLICNLIVCGVPSTYTSVQHTIN